MWKKLFSFCRTASKDGDKDEHVGCEHDHEGLDVAVVSD